MTQSATQDYSDIDIYELLAQRRQVAIIWDIEDVQNMRPDLNDDQAWQVLQRCEKHHDCETGFTWLLIELVAEDLFPCPEGNEKEE